MRLAFVLLFLLSSVAHAAKVSDVGCEAVNYHKDPKNPLRKLPVWDQDGVGICYAYAAATIANYELMKRGKEPIVSPVYAAYLQTFVGLDKNSADGGAVDTTWEMLRGGVCTAYNVNKRLEGLKKAGGFSSAQTLAFLEMVFKMKSNKATFLELEHLYNCNLDNALNWLEARSLQHYPQSGVLDSLFANCPQVPFKMPSLKAAITGTDVAMARTIRDRMLKGNLPTITLGCYSDFESNPKIRSLKGKSPPLSRWSPENRKACRAGENHALIVAGQQMVNGQCHYLLRNSFGSSWRGKGGTACDCLTKSKEYKPICKTSEAAETLGCWYKRDDVVGNLLDLSSL